MKTKLVLWGMNSQDERVLIALELLPEDNKVNIYTFPEQIATEEFSQLMLKDWRNGEEVTFPEGYTQTERELSITEGLLPDELKVERGDIIQRAQTEWHFIVLSAKLNDAYQSELDGLKGRVDKLESYDSEVWNSLKGFWDKVQVQVRDRNLFREHANSLRDNTNALFARMKELRAKLDEEFQRISKDNHDKFMTTLEDMERRINEGLRLQPIFDELKDLQRKFRDTKLTRDHRSKVWERLDAAFKTVKAKRFGDGASEDKSPMERLVRRYDGLIAAIEKMERSIQRDRDDLEFQNRKIANSDGQLEAQIRQAKIKMIEERIRSKEEKLGEMNVTKGELEKRIEAQKEKDAKREEKEKIEEAKRLAEEKIASEIKAAAEAREEESEKLTKAAESISSEKPVKEKVADTINEVKEKVEEVAEAVEEKVEKAIEEATKEDGIVEKVEDAVEDTIDTVKAVASVVGDKIGDALEDLKEKITGEDDDEDKKGEEEEE